MFYMIGRELFSAESPSGLYGAALKACQNNIQVNEFTLDVCVCVCARACGALYSFTVSVSWDSCVEISVKIKQHQLVFGQRHKIMDHMCVFIIRKHDKY